MEKFSPARGDSTPIYLQIAKNIREHISAGEINSGDALPSERDLCEMAGVSRVTIRKAIDKLITEGLLLRKQGSGTFVAPRIEAPGSFLSGFSDDARARGDAPSAIWIVKSYARPTDDEAEALGISVETKVARLGRVRLSDGEPLAIEHAVAPAEFLPKLSDIGESLYDAFEQVCNRPVRGRQKIRASLATPTEAGLLMIAEKSEVLRIERITRRADDTIVEFTRSAYRGDKYDFVSDLT
ncbi:MAG: GntR family transcriptional regulator [Pseudomonadota bacterium]